MAWEWVRQKCWKTKRKWSLSSSVIRKSFIQEAGYCWHSAVASAWPSTCDQCHLMTFPDLCSQACRKFSSRHAIAHTFALLFSPHLSPGRTPFCLLCPQAAMPTWRQLPNIYLWAKTNPSSLYVSPWWVPVSLCLSLPVCSWKWIVPNPTRPPLDLTPKLFAPSALMRMARLLFLPLRTVRTKINFLEVLLPHWRMFQWFYPFSHVSCWHQKCTTGHSLHHGIWFYRSLMLATMCH